MHCPDSCPAATAPCPVSQCPPQQQQHYYASGFDEHIHNTVQSMLHADHSIPTTTASHLVWLQRMYTRVLIRQLELDRREEELARREAAAAALKPAPQKSRRARNNRASPRTNDAFHPPASEPPSSAC